MIKLREYYLNGVVFIRYNDGLKGSILLNGEKGIIPIELKDEVLAFITIFPNVLKKLKEGKVLYINSFNGYLGKEETEAPYCEQSVFVYEYASTGINIYELLGNMENELKNGNPMIRKLSKIGNNYKDY